MAENDLFRASVAFSSSDCVLCGLMEAAAERCAKNIRYFGDRRVLIEGGGYHKIWLETQPMGGAMYAKRDPMIGRNNQLLFMEHQRSDGRIPGSIALENGRIVPEFNKFQGFCFPQPALDMYYLTGNREYLTLLEETLRRFDEYLWRVRDSDGDGCLEAWCRYDTGEDNAIRFGDGPDAWSEESPPAGCAVVPIGSMDVMSYSYSARDTLAEIRLIRGDKTGSAQWREKADAVAGAIRRLLWDEQRGALFDLDREHRRMPQLIHNTLRAMYWKSISGEMADRFLRDHLLNPAEFWTPMPLPSIAVNDPDFRNIPTNDWNGQVQALTYQRAIRALENYERYELIPVLGNKLFAAIAGKMAFVQQYDPFTGEPSLNGEDADQNSYGPALLAVMEYMARMYGVDRIRDRLVWGAACGPDTVYTQTFGEAVYRMELCGDEAAGFIGDRQIFRLQRGVRIESDLTGSILKVSSYGGERPEDGADGSAH